MSAIEALRLRQEAVLPAACLLKLGPLQKTAGPGRNFPGELGQSQTRRTGGDLVERGLSAGDGPGQRSGMHRQFM